MSSYEKLLNTLDKSFISKWQSIESKPQSLIDQLDDLLSTIDFIKELNEEKKISSAKIGKLKKAGDDFSSILEEQKQIKNKLKVFKSKKSELQKLLKEFFESLDEGDQVPARFIMTNPVLRQNNDDYSIRTIEELDPQKVDSYLENHPHTTPYHYSCWRKLIKSLFHHDDISLVAVNQSSEITGLLPLTRMKSMLFGDFAVSMPYFNYGGPIANHLDIETFLVNSAIDIAKINNVTHIELRELKPREKLHSKTEKVSMIRKLPETNRLFSSQIGTKVRAQINRSNQEKPVISIGKLELINDFYKVFSINMRDLGTPVYSKEFFSRVIKTWYEHSFVVVVYMSNKPVAAAILLGYRDVMEIPWASALKETNKIGINMFMYWNILNFAIDNNYEYFDFGRSSSDSGTYKFKKQWGAIPQQNYWNYWLPEGESLPQLNPNNVKYKFLISTWKRLPVTITNLLGPSIVKNIP